MSVISAPNFSPPTLNHWPLWIELAPTQRVSRGWTSTSWSVVELSAQPRSGEGIFQLDLVLYRGERLAYRFNLASQAPKLFVVCEAVEPEVWQPRLITASQDEVADYMDAGQPVLDLPMPRVIHQWIDAFIAHHGEPEMGRQRRGQGPAAQCGEN